LAYNLFKKEIVMEKADPQELMTKLDDMNKSLARIAEGISVLKVTTIAMIIALLMVITKNFMR
jgi:hypothetical protein